MTPKTRGYGWGRRIAIAATLALGAALALAGPAMARPDGWMW
jgi:hypothetical protein